MDNQQLILTTEQLAQAFGVTPNALIQNFRRHKEDFTEGKHYFLLEGEDLKNFERDSQSSSKIDHDSERNSNNDILSERTSKGGARKKYLWTQKGAFAHAWILKSPGAKAAYEKLIERAEQPQTVGISQETYEHLEKKYQLALDATIEAIEISPMQGVDYALFDEFDRLIRRGHKLCWNLQQATTDSASRKILEEILPLLKKLETLGTQLQEQHEKLDEKFIEQASTLTSLQPPTVKLLK